jgi:hypothetical protein
MHGYARRRIEELVDDALVGFVLKKDSPTCGLERVKVYGTAGMPVKSGRGLFAHALARARLCAERYDARLNCFGVNASQPLAVWRRSGWIHKQDPRGWFQWYCRYYMGRRTADDARQIRRWRAIARHVAAIRKHCEPGDLECRRRQRQAVLHWAYDSRKISEGPPLGLFGGWRIASSSARDSGRSFSIEGDVIRLRFGVL